MDSKTILIYFRIQLRLALKGKYKEKGRKNKEKETKDDKIQIRLEMIKAHRRNSELDLCKIMFWFNSEFGCIFLSFVLLLWDLGENQLPAESNDSITLDNGMATARNVGTAGWLFLINFAHRVKARNNICLVYNKFNALSYDYKLSFWGGLSLYMVWCTFWTQLDRPLLK